MNDRKRSDPEFEKLSALKIPVWHNHPSGERSFVIPPVVMAISITIALLTIIVVVVKLLL